MDETDHEILRHLVEDGRLTNVELSRRLLLSPTPTLRRVRALERSGVITGYHAAVSNEALGRNFEVLISVNLDVTAHKELEAFETAVSEMDEVVEAFRLYGNPDFIIRVAVKDNKDYEQFYSNELIRLPGVSRAWSQMIMKRLDVESGPA